jgi:peptide/nickel transport system permease protein
MTSTLNLRVHASAARTRGGAALWRIVHLVSVLILVTFAGVALAELMPGSPAAIILGPEATDEAIRAFEQEHGFDQPLFVRYANWMVAALQGDLGVSVQNDRPVVEILLQRLPVTLELTVLALLVSLLLAVTLALISASRKGGAVDRVVSALSSGLMSIPVFVIALVLIYAFAVTIQAFPVAGWASLEGGLAQNLRFAFLPILALALGEFPAFYRLLRGDLIATLGEDFVTTATVRGLSRPYVLVRHVLRPSSASLVTVAGVAFGRLLAGSVVVESLFALPGLGSLALQSIPSKDIPVIQGIIVLVAVTYVVINAVVDVLYARLDPRVRAS